MGRDKILEILDSHIKRYPRMEVDDVYKLCHHASMGSEHAITDKKSVEDWLHRELQNMGGGPEEPLVDEIASDGRIIRVHLRPYFEARDDPKALLDAFIKTAYEFKKNEGLMVAYWNVLDEMAAADALPKSLKDYNEFFTRMQLNGFPAVHHSAEYEKAYRPAYRVIAREYFNLA
jgi:hypothetical protein